MGVINRFYVSLDTAYVYGSFQYLLLLAKRSPRHGADLDLSTVLTHILKRWYAY